MRIHKTLTRVLKLLGCMILVVPAKAQAQSPSIDWDVLSGGTAKSAGSGTILLMNAGQNAVEISSGSGRILRSGFLAHPLLTGSTVSVAEQEEVPTTFELFQNYPNPFNPSTRIRFTLPRESHVRLTIYNLLGQKITTIVDQDRLAGVHTVEWSGTNSFGQKVGSGVYFYRVEAKPISGGGLFVSLKKMIMLK